MRKLLTILFIMLSVVVLADNTVTTSGGATWTYGTKTSTDIWYYSSTDTKDEINSSAMTSAAGADGGFSIGTLGENEIARLTTGENTNYRVCVQKITYSIPVPSYSSVTCTYNFTSYIKCSTRTYYYLGIELFDWGAGSTDYTTNQTYSTDNSETKSGKYNKVDYCFSSKRYYDNWTSDQKYTTSQRNWTFDNHDKSSSSTGVENLALHAFARSSSGKRSVTTYVTYSDEQINYTFYNKIQYDLNGGSGSFSEETEFHNSRTLPATTPEKTGYTFAGWMDKNGTIYDSGATLTASEDLRGPITLTAQWSAKSTVYAKSDATYPFRIPALTQNKDGKIIAIADNRPCGQDIGNGRVDIISKTSDDGSTWSTKSSYIAQGSGTTETNDYGYGDAAVVADRESNKVLVISCYGKTGETYFSGKLSSARQVSSDGCSTWSTPTIMTASEKNTLLGTTNCGSFFSSGRILQSQYTKKTGSQYYRIYSGMCVQSTSGSYTPNSYVVYSDDFGVTWNVLGGGVAVTGGDECKIEELPDGRIVISSRKTNGRYFNIFTYTDTENAVGSWGTQSTNTTIAANDTQGTNGEILIVPAKDASNNDVYIALQSAPNGGDVSGTATGRSHLSVYYKVLDAYASFKDPATFATGWTLSKELSSTTSAYSTMILQQDGNIGVLYEENYDATNKGYDIIYNRFALSELASGYSLNTNIDRKTFVTNYFNAYEAAQTSWSEDIKAEYEELVAALADGITTAELDAIYSFIANPIVNLDGKVVTLMCVGNTEGKTNSKASSTFSKYVYNNNGAIGVTATAPTNERSYDFIMHKGSKSGAYTFVSFYDNTKSLGLDTSDHLCLSSTAQEFVLTKWSNMSGYTGYGVMMDGYALQSKRVNTSGNDSILVAISSAGTIDRLNYTSQSFGSNYFTTDFTITICKYALTSDDKNVYAYSKTISDDDITGAHTFIGSADNLNSLVYLEAASYSGTKDNVVVKGTDDKRTCSSLVLTDKVDVSIPHEFTASAVTYKRTSTAKWGTIVLPYGHKQVDGYTYYALSGADLDARVLKFTEVEVDPLEANKPYLYKNNSEGTSYDASTASSTGISIYTTAAGSLGPVDTKWYMKGIYQRTTIAKDDSQSQYTDESNKNKKIIDANSYYIRSDGAGFVANEDYFNVSAFRAYFTTTVNGAKPSFLTFALDDLATDARIVENKDDGTVDVIFNVFGQKLNEPQKGCINIINGRKVLVK